MPFTITVDGVQRQVVADDGRSLLEVLREDLGITGPKLGCGEGACGACTVLIGRRAVTACSTPAAEVAGQRVTTVEGLAEDGLLHPVQQAWLETGAMQCGYCTPGWLMATAALLNRVSHPDDARIAAELAGNVCRCCTYPRILRAIRRAAELMEEPELLEPVPATDVGLRPGGRAARRSGTAALGPGQGRGALLRAATRWPGDGRRRRRPRSGAGAGPVGRARRRLGARGSRRLGDGVHRQGRGRPGHPHRAGSAGRRGTRRAARRRYGW